ncbi:MAG: hypothetical protein ABW203_05120 [Novosphingobium sp.]
MLCTQAPSNIPASSVERDLVESEEMMLVANDLLRGYLTLTARGYHPRTVAMAMMGATVNLFDALELNGELPGLLRAIADRVGGSGKAT